MTALQPAAAAVEQARRTLAAAADALVGQWRDVHALAFENAYLSPLALTTVRLHAALADADRAVDAALAEMRALGGSSR